jgi:V/A-type H+/Na+-transporting ATPase subunit E
MKKELLSQIEDINRENAQELCEKIRQDGDYEVGSILSRAKKEADAIAEEGRKQAEKKAQELAKETDKDTAKIKEKIFSTLSMEKKRIILEDKNSLLAKVLERVKKLAEEFRRSKDYPDFLASAVLEGAKVIDAPEIDIQYSQADAKIFTEGFAAKMQALCGEKLGRKQVMKFQSAGFEDIGVIVRSLDGRLSYDNRFISRLNRVYDEVYMELLRGA